MSDLILINGEHQHSLSAYDRGLHYGDGVFETMAVHAGTIPLWSLHWQRLLEGCEKLSLPKPNQSILEKEWQQFAIGQQKAIIKIIYTRGSGGRGYAYPEKVEPTRLVLRYPWREYAAENAGLGVNVRLCKTRLSSNPQLAGIKHLNRLEQILARNEWQNVNCVEGLMLNQQNQVIDGTMSNVFIVKDGVLMTPSLSSAGVDGVMRRLIVQLAKTMATSCKVQELTLHDIETADEMFICNSLFGIWPVKQFEQQQYSVGKLTQQLQLAVTEYINKAC